MTNFFNKILEQYTNNLPFVAYRKPNDTNVSALFQDNTLVNYVKDYSESGFVFAPFNASEKAVVISFNDCLTVDYTSEYEDDFCYNDVDFDCSDKQLHMKLVSKGISEIQNTDLKKVVLSRVEVVELKKDDPLTVFRAALAAYQNAFVYLWYHPNVGCWLGATPEVLLRTRNNQFSTMSLAGTQVYSDDLTWETKEQEEQHYVTDYITKRLSSKGIQPKVGEPYTVKAGHLAHIRTDVSGSFNKDNLKQLLDVLHPTPAVCGLPKKVAKTFILKNEAYQRTFYTGFLGELNKPIQRKKNKRNVENNAYRIATVASDLYVNLRCMELKEGKAKIYVGGGITASSDPEKEFIETCNKTKTMKKLIIS
jgi:isochorismate synthase